MAITSILEILTSSFIFIVLVKKSIYIFITIENPLSQFHSSAQNKKLETFLKIFKVR